MSEHQMPEHLFHEVASLYPNRLAALVGIFCADDAEPLVLPAPPGASPLYALCAGSAPIADVRFEEDPPPKPGPDSHPPSEPPAESP